MDQCPKCGSYTVEHDPRSEAKVCYLLDCDYVENYCRERWNIEHDMLWKLAGRKENTMKCYRPRGLRMCDDCDLRATYPAGWNKRQRGGKRAIPIHATINEGPIRIGRSVKD